MLQIFKSLPSRISQPVIREWPLFLLFFLFISPSTLASFCMNIANENGIAGIAHRIPLALFLSYIMACAAYLSGKTWVKTIIYVFSVALLATDTFLHHVFHIYIQPFMVMLIGETNHQEAGEFFGTFVLSRGGLFTLLTIAFAITLLSWQNGLDARQVNTFFHTIPCVRQSRRFLVLSCFGEDVRWKLITKSYQATI